MAIVSDVEIRLRADIARLQQDMTAARRTVETATDGMAKAINKVKEVLSTLAVGVGIGAGVTEVIKMADAYTKFTAQLKLASASQTDYANSLVSVKRIATDAQSSLEKTAVLYARIANGTRELGLSQQKVADITETVSLSLKVSGATAEESSSAMLQLSQAFASGTLRGEEFNAVNEAAPRLMKALADGIGVPIGALRTMASDGKLTSAVLADALPKALQDLRKEGANIQTISGAMQVLKDRVMEFTATQAQANGTVSTLTAGIGLLADNLGTLMNVLVTAGAAKFGSMLTAWTTSTYRQVAANAALSAANLAVADTQVTNTAATLATANARVVELRAAIASAEGDVALALALNGLVPAQARAAAAAAAHTAALGAQATAARAASVATTVGSRALALLGGPVGAVITVLGLAATAWSYFGSKSDEANKKSAETTTASTEEVVAQLQKQIEKLEERNKLFGKAPDVARAEGPAAEKQRELLKQIDDVQKNNNLTLETKTEIVRVLTLQYGEVTNQVYRLNAAQAENDKNMNGDKLKNWLSKNTQYLTDAEKLANTIAQARKELGDAFNEDVEKRIRTSFGAADAKKYAGEVQSLTKAIQERTAASVLDAQVQGQMTDGQAFALKIMEDLRNGTLKLTDADKKRVAGLLEGMLASEAANAGLAEAAKWYKKVSESAVESRAGLDAEANAVEGLSETRKQTIKILAELEKYGEKLTEDQKAKIKQDRAELDSLSDLNEARKRERDLQDQRIVDAAQQVRAAEQQSTVLEDQIKYYGLTEEAVLKLKAAELSRQLQNQDLDAIERGRLEGLLDETQRQITAQTQLSKMKADTAFWTNLEDAAHQTFLSIGNGNKDLWTRMRDTAKNIFFEWLYQMTLKKWLINIGTTISGTAGVSGIANAAGSSGGASSVLSVASVYSAAKSAYAAIGSGFEGIATSVADGVQSILYATGQSSSILSNSALATQIGSIASTAAGAAIGKFIGGQISGQYELGNHGSAITNVATIAGAILGGPIGGIVGGTVGGLINRAFGMGAKNVTNTTLSGTLSATGADINALQAWTQKGGWFRSDKSGTDTTSVGATQNAAFASAYKAILDVSKVMGDTIGADTAALSTRVQQLKIDLTGITDAAKQQEAITKFFSGVADTISTELVPNLTQFQKEGETLSDTLQRLATDYAAVDVGLDAIGKSFGAVGVSSLAAREALIAAAGGIDKLSSGLSYFQQNFLTDAERLAPVQKQVADSLAAMGLSSITTVEQFKQYALGLDLTNQAQAETFTKLLALAPAFKQVADAADAANAAAATAAEQAKAAAEAAATAAATAAKTAANTAFDALSAAIAARKTELKTQFDAALSAVATNITSVSSAIDNMRNVVSVVRGAVDSLLGTTADSARKQLAQIARSGATPQSSDLQSLASAASQFDTSQYATAFEARRAQLLVANDLETIAGNATANLSNAQAMLASLQMQQAAIQAASDAETARLDKMLAQAQAQIDAINGVNSSVLTVAQALAGFKSSVTSGATAGGWQDVAPQSTGTYVRPGTDSFFDSSAVVAQLQAIAASTASAAAAQQTTAASTSQLANQFDNVSAGGNALLTEANGVTKVTTV